MMEVLAGYATVISGVVDAVEAMRARGMKIAGTTGYTRPMLDRLEDAGSAAGLSHRSFPGSRRCRRRPALSMDVLPAGHGSPHLSALRLREDRRHRVRHRGRPSMPACGPSA